MEAARRYKATVTRSSQWRKGSTVQITNKANLQLYLLTQKTITWPDRMISHVKLMEVLKDPFTRARIVSVLPASCVLLLICRLTLQSSRSMLSRLLLRWTRPLILRSDGFPWLTATPGGTAPDEVAASELGGTLGHKCKTAVHIIRPGAVNYKQSSVTGRRGCTRYTGLALGKSRPVAVRTDMQISTTMNGTSQLENSWKRILH